jgi:hypothetical protein
MDMLFTWSAIAESHSDIVAKWLRFRRESQAACDIFFGLQYAPPSFVQMRFLLTTIALALILSNQAEDSEAYRAVEILRQQFANERDRQWLDVLPTKAEVLLPWNVFAFASQYPGLLRPIIGDDIAAFVTQLVTTRQQLFQGVARETDPERGLRLWQFAEKASLLFKMAMLSALGFSQDEISQIISRNRLYLFLQA